jgi:hypothetical protein
MQDVFELLECHDQLLTLDGLVEIREQNFLVKVDAPDAQSTKRTTTVSKATKELELAEFGTRMFNDVEWNEQRTATTRKGIIRKSASMRCF